MKICNRCELCKNYVYLTPTWSDPSYEEYCKKYGDFCDMEHEKIECNGFELSGYGKVKILFQIDIMLYQIQICSILK